MTTHRQIETPIGPLTLVAAGGALTRIEFGAQAIAGEPAREHDDELVLAAAERQLDAHFDGELERFDLPLDAAGTDFQQRVWAQLRQIPYGTTTSYGALARAQCAARDAAPSRKPVAQAAPCH